MDVQLPKSRPFFSLDRLYKQFPVSNRVGSIRLIQLMPGRALEPIVCTMSFDCLDDRPYYTALSYVWGDATVLHPISVNGMLFPVTSNLYSALTHIRDEQVQQTLWVDAICINQDDNEERGNQVSQMIRVYEQADQVIAWLGECEDDSDLAIGYIMSQARDDYHAAHGRQRIEDSLIKLWCRPYWTRVWVIQELAMARRAVVACGFQRTTLESVREFIELKRLEAVQRNDAFLWKPRRLLDLSSGGSKKGVLHVLWECARLQVTEPLDRIYGVLGVLPAPYRKRIDINYNRTFRDLMLEVFNAYIDVCGDLDILTMFSTSQYATTASWPTWLPDARHRLDGMGEFYRACGGQTAMSKISGHILTARGVLIGKINLLKGPFENRKELLIMRQASDRQVPRSSKDSMRKVQNLAISYLHKSHPREASTTIQRRFFNMVAGDHMHLQSSNICPFSCQQLWQAGVDLEENGNPEKFEEKALHFEFMFGRLKDRCFFITDGGRVGLGPCNVHPGDFVSVLYGCRLPVVLRPKITPEGHIYTFVGPAYVDDAMMGECVSPCLLVAEDFCIT